VGLGIFMSDSPDPVAAGDKLTYDVSVDVPVGETVAVTETIPASASYVEADSDCPQSPGSQFAVCGGLLGGQHIMKFVVIPNVAGTLVNEASVVSEATGESASATVTTQVVPGGLPSLSIGDATVAEGNAGATQTIFTVSLSGAASSTVSVDYSTADGTASAGSDYAAKSGSVSFAPGDPLSKTVQTDVNGDLRDEPDEAFSVNLSNPSGALISDGLGMGTIVDDDDAIAFQRNGDIYTMNEDGTGVRQLTAGSAYDAAPAWSPNREQIAFSSNRDGVLNNEIYVMNADGSAVTRLTFAAGSDYGAAWSPVGDKIAYSRSPFSAGIYLMNADGSGSTRLTVSAFPNIDTNPTWSPTGDEIAFQRWGTIFFESDLHVVKADGTGLTQLTSDAPLEIEPAWSSGSEIAFACNCDRSQGRNFDIYALSRDGGPARRLTTHVQTETHPDWSASGDQLVFVRSGWIHLMNADGSGATPPLAPGHLPDW